MGLNGPNLSSSAKGISPAPKVRKDLKMTNLTFAGCAYRTPSDLADAIVAAWLTADGLNTDQQIRDILDTNTDAEIVSEIVSAWEVSAPADDLTEAAARFRAGK